MSLKMIVESLDAIPEAQRPLYKQDGEKFRLDLDGYEDTTGLKSALEKERTEKRDAVSQAKAWKALGKTPEEIQQLLVDQAKADQDKLTKAGEWDKLRGQMTEQHQVELTKREQTAAALRKQLERHLVDAAAATALATAEGNAELLMPHVQSKVKVIEDEGEFVVRIVDAAGNPRVDGKGEFLSIKDLVSEMRANPIYAPGFPKAQGSGAPGSHKGPTGNSKATAKIDGTPEERTEYIKGRYPGLA